MDANGRRHGVVTSAASQAPQSNLKGQGPLQAAKVALAGASCSLQQVVVRADNALGVVGTACGGGPGAPHEVSNVPLKTATRLEALRAGSAELIDAISDLFGVYDYSMSDILANTPDANVSVPQGTVTTGPALALDRLERAERDLGHAIEHLGKVRASPSAADVLALALTSAEIIKRIDALVGPCRPTAAAISVPVQGGGSGCGVAHGCGDRAAPPAPILTTCTAGVPLACLEPFCVRAANGTCQLLDTPESLECRGLLLPTPNLP